MTHDSVSEEIAKRIYEEALVFGDGHQPGYGFDNCAAANEGDLCCIEKAKEHLISKIATALAHERQAGREEQNDITNRYARMIELMSDGMPYDEAFSSTKPE